MSLRTRLILAITTLVALLSVGSLLVIERGVESQFRQFSEMQLQEQNQLFLDQRQERTRAIIRMIVDGTRNPRLIAALDESVEIDDRSGLIYSDLGTELSPLLQRYLSSETHADSSGPFFRVFDSKGEPVRLPDNLDVSPERAPGSVPGLAAGYLHDEIQSVAIRTMKKEGTSEGYLALPPSSIRPQLLYEVFVHPMIDDATGDTLGAIALGLPISDLRELHGRKSGIRSALHVGDLFFSDGPGWPGQLESESMEGEVILEGEKFGWIRQSLIQPPGFSQASQISAFSLSGREKTRTQLRRIILLGAIGAMIVGIALGVMISDRITQPIRALVVETNEIHEGRFGHQLPVRSRDELGQLTTAFNEMSADLELKELYRDLLDRVTDRRVAEELISGKIELSGELREVTTLFCDIRGFTALTEGMPPREVFDFLNEHMTALTEVVSRHNGVVDKFVGDEIMVVFGAPVSYENDALDAVACALEMIQARSDLNEKSLHPLHIGIGIATGPGLAGRMGSQDRQNYTVLGERVNLAARLCGRAQATEILIDDATRDQLTSEFCVKSLGEIELKGFSRLIETFQVSDEPTQFPATPR